MWQGNLGQKIKFFRLLLSRTALKNLSKVVVWTTIKVCFWARWNSVEFKPTPLVLQFGLDEIGMSGCGDKAYFFSRVQVPSQRPFAGPLTAIASIKTWSTKYIQWEHKPSVSNVDKMCWPSQSCPALRGLTAMACLNQTLVSVADLTNVLVCTWK